MSDFGKNECNLGCRLTKRLFGQILVDGEFVPPADLEKAVEKQKHTNELLGGILVRMGTVSPRELDTVLFVQRDFASMKDTAKAAAGIRQLLGSMLISARKMTPAHLELALSEQIETDEKLGEILVRTGLMTESELDAVLAFQHCQNCGASSEHFRLGEILVATDHITREQLEDALTRQKISKKNIGEVLVEAGYAESHHIEYGLNIQRKLITAALIAALSLTPLRETEEADASDSGKGYGSATINVTATIQSNVIMKIIRQSQELVVTNDDIHRGYVDAPGASVIEVRSNSPSGYFIVFEGVRRQLGAFKAVHVQGLEREVQVDFSGGMVARPDTGRGPVTLELSYRFLLSDRAGPGTCAWPLVISVIPR